MISANSNFNGGVINVVNKFIASQLKQPSGAFGWFLLGRLLNKFNARINQLSVELLALQPSDHVLEIGFGGGATLGIMAKRIDSGKIYGVDFSEPMVQQAKRKFQPLLQSGKLVIQFADVQQLPFESGMFDKVCTVNTIYFWPDPLVGLREIRRVMKRGGKLVVAIRSADKMKNLSYTQYNFRLYSPTELRSLLKESGFTGVAVDHRDQQNKLDCVMASAYA